MINSLKQMARTPVRTVLFLILMFFAALLLTLGTCIWLKGNRTMAQYEDRFMTIGTVRQIPDSFEQTLQWNAETKDYDVRKKPSIVLTIRRRICSFREQSILQSRNRELSICLMCRSI